VQDKGDAQPGYDQLREVRPFVTKDQGYLIPKKRGFNRIIGDSGFELEFAKFLRLRGRDFVREELSGHRVQSRITSRQMRHFQLLPGLSRETAVTAYYCRDEGQQDVDAKPKILRLKQWCEDVNRAGSGVTYDFVYVDEESLKKYRRRALQPC